MPVPVPDSHAALAWDGVDVAVATAVLRGLAFASVTAAVRGGTPRPRIDATAIAVLWPLVVPPALAGRRRERARAWLAAPLPGHDPEAPAPAVSDLAVLAAAAVMRPSVGERLILLATAPGGVAGGAEILAVVAALALGHPGFVSAVDAVVRHRLRPEVLLPRRADPLAPSDRGLLTLIAMVQTPRPRLAVPTRRQRFARAFADYAAALWGEGEIPRGVEAWLFTEALRSFRSRMDPRLAALARSADLGGCPRYGGTAETAGDGAIDYGVMPEPLARFLRRET